MNKKNCLINWTPLSPVEIYERHLAMYDWSNKAEKVYLGLETDFAKGQIKNLLVKLLRKTSAVEALKVMVQISEELHLPNLLEFCTQEKFIGLLGINHVVNMTLTGIIFHSGVKEDLTNILGGISIDYNRRAKLGIMLEEHDELQEEIYLLTLNQAENVKKLITRITACSMSKRYPLNLMLEYGEEIKKILCLTSNPIKLGLHWCKINFINQKSDFDFQSIAKDKQDGGYFQYLCIVLFSQKF